jgi:hypothetical protein
VPAAECPGAGRLTSALLGSVSAVAILQQLTGAGNFVDHTFFKEKGASQGPLFSPRHSQSLCKGLGAGGPSMQGIALKYS